MKKAYVALIAGLLVIVIPATAFAATYEYVDRQGVIRTLVAATAEEALRLSAPFVFDSGVKLGNELFKFYGKSVQGTDMQSTPTYRYVNTVGNLKTVAAASAEEAFAKAADREPTSGVQLVK